ncbi:MAG TPA: type IX secretion system membrane protein PorP/SprF [Bacteroidia bacterium]|nr:type IX secretion system membrane protein PorP/SprF [Bacteroidia bacterium]
MKRILFFTFSLFTFGAIAQQLPAFSQYIYNDFLLNPAIAGTKDYAPVSLSARMQWVGFNNAPTMQIGSIHGALNKNVGLGLTVTNVTTGPISNTTMQLAYSYRIKLNENTKLSFGLAPMIIQQSLQKDKLTLDNQNDNTFNRISGKTMIADADAGVYLYGKKYFVSLSVPQLLENKVRLGDALFTERLKRTYVLYGGYDFAVKEKFILTPSVLVKAMEGGAPIQVDVNFKATYNKLVWLGLSFRGSSSQSPSEVAVASIGVTKYNFVLGYSYDYSLSSISSYSSGSHEVFLTYKIRCKKGTETPKEVTPVTTETTVPVTEPAPTTPIEQPK